MAVEPAEGPVAACHFHPDRPGVGVCMRCRAPICAACCTRLSGINHCHACLAALARGPGEGRRSRPRRALGAVLLLAAFWLFLCGLAWLFFGSLAP
jgi:hypothetical protein